MELDGFDSYRQYIFKHYLPNELNENLFQFISFIQHIKCHVKCMCNKNGEKSIFMLMRNIFLCYELTSRRGVGGT